ncbi:MAG: hypothetical protein ACLTSX_12730 [Collinsella sp.]
MAAASENRLPERCRKLDSEDRGVSARCGAAREGECAHDERGERDRYLDQTEDLEHLAVLGHL